MEPVFETAVTGNEANRDKPMPELQWRHKYIQNFATVAKTRRSEPIEMYYELHGTGPKKVALLMGMNAACQSWDYQTEYFGSMNEYSILTFDARGVGWTGGGWDSYNTHEWALDFLELLDCVGWVRDVHSVGHSAGGQALMKALLLNTIDGRFLSASLLNTTTGGLRPLAGPLTIISNLFVNDAQEQMKRLIRINFTENWLRSRPDDSVSFETNFDKIIARTQDRNRRNRPQSVGSMISQAMASLRHWVPEKDLAIIRRSRVPVLVVSNSWDNFAYLSHSAYLNEALQAWRFVVFDDTGHSVPSARPAELNKLFEEFWKHAETKEGFFFVSQLTTERKKKP